MQKIVKPNWQYLGLAFLLAVFCWYLVTGREKVDVWVPVRLEMTGAPKGLFIKGGMINSVEALVRAPKGMAGKFEAAPLVYSLDLSRLSAGRNIINFDPKAIPVTKVFSVEEVRPSRMELDVELRITRVYPVKVVLKKALPQELLVTKAATKPQEVKLTGAENALDRIQEIKTQPIALENPNPGVFKDKIALDVPEDMEADPVSVEVTLDISVKQAEAVLKVPIKAEPPTGMSVSVSPKTVTLTIKGPMTLVGAEDFKDKVEAVLELKAGLEPGKSDSVYHVRMPQECELLSANPETVAVTAKKTAEPARQDILQGP